MTVSDEAVEAAAKAFYGDAYEDIFQADKEFPQAQMRKALTAAAPFIAAQAWDEGEKAGIRNYRYMFQILQVGARARITNPHRSGS